MRLANPWLLLLLPVVVGFLFWGWRRFRGTLSGVLFPNAPFWKDLENKWIQRLFRARPWIRCAVIVLVFLAVLRPQWDTPLQEVTEPGVDVIVAMDVSGSMAAEDFSPANRLVAAKNVAREFILSRPNDRIGMIAFGTFALTQCPLTTDHAVLVDLVDRVRLGEAGEDTAIGLGLATAVSRLRRSDAKSKVVILITDGINNAGGILPQTAAVAARDAKIRVYTIGIGKEGGAPIPYMDPVKGKQYEVDEKGTVILTEIDEAPLKDIARITGGKYFRATDEKVLKSIYKTIDQLEKSPSQFKIHHQYTELFPYFLWVAVVLLAFEILVFRVIWRAAP